MQLIICSNCYLSILIKKKKKSNFKDLEITFNSKFNFTNHILCYVMLNVSEIISLDVLLLRSMLITSLQICVLHLFEYASTLWNQNIRIHRCGSINNVLIDQVECTFTKRIFYKCNLLILTNENRLNFLNLTSPSNCRLLADLTLSYKLMNNILDVQVYSIINTFSNLNRWPRSKIMMDAGIIEL